MQVIVSGYSLVALLMLIGIVLLIAEMMLPSHGVLGLGAAGCILGAIFVASRQNTWAGLALLLAVAAMTPFAWVAFVKIWPRTPIGRRVVLPPVTNEPPQPLVRVGQAGVTMSELRPIGVCDFDGVRIEAHSEHGIVPPGTAVRVVALVNNRPTVRVA
jgi:membrane-bound ClpP family serine protease